jgi:hypothetical protein
MAVLAWGASLEAADPRSAIVLARSLYNERAFEAAIQAAEEARLDAAHQNAADLIAARAYLERYRQTADVRDLDHARDRLNRIAPEGFTSRERIELVVGLGQALYFEDAVGASAIAFGTVLADPSFLPHEDRERVLDWWASAMDRDARRRPEAERRVAYAAILERMRAELGANAGSTVAAYWLSAAAWGDGNIEGAWDAAQAGWVRAPLTSDRGASLRGDLDRLVRRGIGPERARTLAVPAETVLGEWESFKERWTRPVGGR